MKIDWKSLCKSPGYVSLKKAVVENIARRHRNKKETYQMFYATINRAKHYAHYLNKSLEQVLNEWEEKRNSNHGEWVIQFYPGHYKESHRLPKLHNAPNVNRMTPRTYYKKDPWYKNDPVKKKARSLRIIMEEQAQNSKRKGKKARWTKEKKAREKRLKEYKKQEVS